MTLHHSLSRFFRVFSLIAVTASLPYGAYAEDTAEANTAKQKVDLLSPLEGDHLAGDPNAPVLVIEYASLSCTHCAHFYNDTYPALKEKYIDTGKAAFIYRHYPLNEPALRGAMLAECSGDKFHTFLKVLFRSQDKWAFTEDFMSALRGLANVGGISNSAFDDCMTDKELEDKIISGLKWAADDLQVESTPTLFINGEKVSGSRNIEELSTIIDSKTSAE